MRASSPGRRHGKGSESPMKCWSREELDAAAMRLVSSGRPWPSLWPTVPDDAMPSDLVPLVTHARLCSLCGELLRLFLMTEERLHRGLEASERERTRGGRVVLLWPIGSAQASESASPGRLRGGSYQLAADAPGDRAGAPGQPPVRELTLSSDDNRLIVRIFPNDGGAGATAVLVGSPEPPDPSERAQVSAAAEPADAGSLPRVLLRIDEEEYSFDERGIASLPGFPAAAVSIVLR